MIEVKQLSFTYPSRTEKVLDNIALSIPRGSLFGLLGPNGAGKTTLLSILSGLLPYASGSILLDGVELATLNHRKQPHCALVPQSLAFYPTLTGRENLEFFAATLGIATGKVAAEVERCLALTQLQNHANKRATTYSGGLKRRLNIAIGLLNSPSLLFLDEPTVGIDAQSRNFILESIRNINAAGTTIIYTSHYMEEVENLCDRIAIIDHGQILLCGELPDILGKTCNLSVFTHDVLQGQQIQALRQQGMNLEQHLQTLTIAISHQGQIPDVLAALNNLHVDIERISYGAQPLEQLFLDKTDRQLRD